MYILSISEKVIVLIQKQIIFLKSAKIELSFDIKFMFVNSLDKMSKIFKIS